MNENELARIKELAEDVERTTFRLTNRLSGLCATAAEQTLFGLSLHMAKQATNLLEILDAVGLSKGDAQ